MVGVDTPLQSGWIAMQTQIIIFMIERTREGGGGDDINILSRFLFEISMQKLGDEIIIGYMKG